MAICEILSVGTELLLGDILDTNAQFLSRELAARGISVLRRTTVGDNAGRLRAALTAALDAADVVLITGGLGPTADDITRDVACETMGFPLQTDPEIAAGLRAFFAGRGMDMPEENLRQAQIPIGGTVFPNPNGTAPGIGLKKDGKCVVLLPGPPREMRPMFLESAVPFLKDYTDGVIVSHTVRTIGIGESAMAHAVADLLESGNPTVAPYAKTGEALLRVTARAQDPAAAQALCEPVLDEIRRRLGEKVYGLDLNGVEEAVVALLKAQNKTIATAESCTAGLIPKRITDVPGASTVFQFGAVTYSNEYKEKILGVRRETLERFGAVSAQTAREMAAGIRRLTGADLGISVTGIAGPGSDGTNKPVGLCYIALDAADAQLCEELNTGRNDREFNRFYNASHALDLARRYLERRGCA